MSAGGTYYFNARWYDATTGQFTEDIRKFDKLQGNEEFIPWEEAKKELGLQD